MTLALFYVLIVTSTVSQSALTKLCNQKGGNVFIYNALKATTSLVFLLIIALKGFSFHAITIFFGTAYGLSICISMYSGYKALCLGPMALTSMFVSFSVTIPLTWGLLVNGEKLTLIQTIAFVLLISAILCLNLKRKCSQADRKFNAKWLFFTLMTFTFNGICSILQTQHQTLYPNLYSNEFMVFAMLVSSIVFFLLPVIKKQGLNLKKAKCKRLTVLSGVCGALANLLTLKLAGLENASILFPVISAGSILATFFCGWLVFKEKPKFNNVIALILGVTSIVLFKI